MIFSNSYKLDISEKKYKEVAKKNTIYLIIEIMHVKYVFQFIYS